MAKSKVKVPKAVAGVRVPKGLRRSGMVASVLNNPVGREVLAAVIVAGAGAAAKALAQHRPSGSQLAHAGERAVDAGSQAASATGDAAKSTVGALGGVASELASYLLPDKASKKAKGKKKKNRDLGSDKKRRKHQNWSDQRH